MSEDKKRFRLNQVELRDEKQPGNPVVALVARIDEELLAVCVRQVLRDDGQEPIPVLSKRSALELAAALIQVAIGQRFTVPGAVALPRPSCDGCGSEVDLDANGLCPECAEVRR